MQVRSGQAKIQSANTRRVEFVSMDVADTALLQSAQAFQFQGETMLFYTVATVISVTPTVVIELVETYNGAHALDEFAPYQVWRDFTPLGLFELSPGDVDIRDAFTYNMRLLDTLISGAVERDATPFTDLSVMGTPSGLHTFVAKS